jgi:hypothetical protein
MATAVAIFITASTTIRIDAPPSAADLAEFKVSRSRRYLVA